MFHLCSVTSSWATKYNFVIFVLHLPKALFWRGFSTEICSQTTPGLTPAPEPRKHGYCSIPVSPAFQQKNDSNFHYFASGDVKRLLYCMYFNSSDLFTRCCAWSLALCAFSICVCTGSRWIWRKIATLSFQCLIFSYSNIHWPYILRRSVPEVVAASAFLPARIFAEVVDALSRSTPSAKPQDHLFKEKNCMVPTVYNYTSI